jgi:hypothetical protein
MWSQDVIMPAPGGSLIIIVNCPYLKGCSVLQVSTLLRGSFWFLVMKMLTSAFPGIQSDCKENGLEQRQIQNEEKMCCFLLLSYIMGLSKESMLFSKGSLSTSYGN